MDSIVNRTPLKFVSDWVIWSFAFFLAFLLRFDFELSSITPQVLKFGGISALLKLFIVAATKTYDHSWRNTSFVDIFKLLMVAGTGSFALLLFSVLNPTQVLVPLSISVLELLTTVILWVGIRSAIRFHLKYRMVTFRKNKGLKNVLIVGAGESGVLMAKEMLKSSNANLRPVAFVDDDAAKIGNKMYGISVLGTIEDIPRLVLLKRIDEIVITMPSVSGDVIRRVVEFCTKTDKPFKIIPAIYDLLSGKVNINALREVAVEDLLRRKPVNLDTIEIEKYISSRTVLVTGAGGSIGSELVRQICRFNPKHIVLVGRGENSIFEMKRSLRNELLSISHSAKIADIRDFSTLEHIFKEQKPEVIFHAAAHKHVPLMEENPAQAVLNNVIGTRNLVNLAVDYGVNYFVNISTDKAVNPTSVMGASKRISEQVVKWGALQANKGEIFVSVRFGNVLGSRGSVIPIFKDQIKSGGPVTVTHPDMIRYFMTIPEASQLVLQAAALKENGSIFVLDMGDPVNISDMARDLIKLSGLEPDKDVKIEYTGVRPGEKMFEELLTAEEGTSMTKYDKVFVAKNGYAYDEKEFSVKLDELLTLALEGDETKIREKIYEMVPSFTGTEAQMS